MRNQANSHSFVKIAHYNFIHFPRNDLAFTALCDQDKESEKDQKQSEYKSL